VGGCDTIELAREFGTPLYVVDEALIRQNCRTYRAAFEKRYAKNDVSFAGKAFLTTAMARLVAQEGLGLDVASAGELYTAIKAEFPAEKILFHGNNKSRAELELALGYSVGRIVVDNFHELRVLAGLATERGITQKIFLRVAPGVDPHTHRLIRTGQEDTKFGFNIKSGDALAAIREALDAAPALNLVGLHCHIGSQLLDASTHEQALDVMVGYIRQVADETGWMPSELDLGGGLGIKYLAKHEPPSHDEFAESVISALTKALDKYNVPAPTLFQEPGRSLVGEAGVTLYTIGAIKTVPIPADPGKRVYVAIDGGMSDNPRPQLYESVYSTLLANKAGAPADNIVTIAGKHCETDILIWDTPIGDVQTGDILAVQSTGAYNYAMASNYNRFTKPACVFVLEGKADLVSVRETLEDVVRLDRVPERLR
jgi:diaminopimelate decarboxylase